MRLPLLLVLVCSCATPTVRQAYIADPVDSHEVQDLQGWSIHVDKALLAGEGKATGDKALELLAARLLGVFPSTALPAQAADNHGTGNQPAHGVDAEAQQVAGGQATVATAQVVVDDRDAAAKDPQRRERGVDRAQPRER
ncbi:MAG TPA: hypothetical protein EYP98_16745 [Planctomycetes bacterium]|nr:hypothetical protein [Planctomycetota bacterium]